MPAPPEAATCRVSEDGKTCQTLCLALLAVCLFLMLGADGAIGQCSDESASLASTTTQPQAGGTTAGAAQDKSASADGTLPQLVVALFRHGVRAPLEAFSKQAPKHTNSKATWPSLPDWGAKLPGDLTTHGADLAQRLGCSYAKSYKAGLPANANVYLWADVDARTIDTAEALERGLEECGLDKVKVDHLDHTKLTDPLFHPFKSGCGVPNQAELDAIVADINKNWDPWLHQEWGDFNLVGSVLNCNAKQCQLPLYQLCDTITAWSSGPRGTSPIQWEGSPSNEYKAGRFPLASGAAEAFFLEYANDMPTEQVGWARVAPLRYGAAKLEDLLRLHEFYFDKTEREPYLAQIQGSNLIKEILDPLRRRAGWSIDGCPHADKESDFVGLVGHDTNIATVSTLLGLSWTFDALPDDGTRPPPNHALPAGALVFELRQPVGGPSVRIQYVTQSPAQMRKPGKLDTPFRVRVRGDACHGSDACDIPLQDFTDLVNKAIGPLRPFLSRCENGQQTCSAKGNGDKDPSIKTAAKKHCWPPLGQSPQ